MKHISLTFICLFFITFIATAKIKTRWVEGVIITIEGDEIKGLIFHDLETDAVKLKLEGKNFKVYPPSKVDRFKYYDKRKKRQRNFVSLPYKHSGRGFYEVFLETSNVALLIKRDNLWEKEYTNGVGTVVAGYPIVGGENVRDSILEEVYIVDSKGISHFYMRNKIGDFGYQTGWEKVHREVLEEVCGDLYEEVKEYAKEKRLSFTNINDLTKVLDYYSKLKEN